LSLVSLLASQQFGRAVFYFSVTAYLVATWYVVVGLLANYGTRMWELIRKAFLFAALIAALIGLISHFSTVLQDYLLVQTPYGERARGAFKDPNVYGPFLCAALLLVINDMITRRLLSLVPISLLCLFSLELLASFSRGAYVNLGVALFMYFFIQLFIIRRRDWIVRSMLIIIFGSIFAITASIVFIETLGLKDFLFDRLQMQSYDVYRFSTQSLALATVADAPFGVGPGQSEILFPLSTHSLYLRIAAENGIFAVLCWIMFLMTTFWISLRGIWRPGPYRDVYACCLAILAGILVNSLVIDSLHWRHFFLFLAIPIGLWQHEMWAAGAAQRRGTRS
jgi:O-antigen ligase